MVNSVFNDALFNTNKELLKKCLLLYVPVCEESSVKGKSKLVNHHKTSAKSKLREAGIRL